MHLLKILTLPDFIANLWLSLQDQERNLSKESRARGRSISHGVPTQHNLALPWDSLLLPHPSRTPAIAQALYDLGKPFAILVPGDLVYLIAMRADRHDVTLQKKMDMSSKIAFMADNLVWLCYLPDGPKLPHHVFTVDVEEPRAPLRLRTPPSRSRIQSEQLNDPVCAPWTEFKDGTYMVQVGSKPIPIAVHNRTVYRLLNDPPEEAHSSDMQRNDPLFLPISLVPETIRLTHETLVTTSDLPASFQRGRADILRRLSLHVC